VLQAKEITCSANSAEPGKARWAAGWLTVHAAARKFASTSYVCVMAGGSKAR